MKYISDKAASPDGSLIYVPDGGGFTDMVKHKGDIEIGDKVNKIIGKLAEANALKGVIDLADFNDESKLGRGREMVDRISKLIAIFEGLDLRMNRAEGDDLLGDAYEYLMRHFATESGKSKGQFYTPSGSLSRHGKGHRHRSKYPPIGCNLRPDMRLRVPTAQGCRRVTRWYECLRTGKGYCDPRTGADEHDPSRR